MSFLRNLPCRDAENFSLLLAGDREGSSLGLSRRQTKKVVEYIALNDTRPPDNQVINMCHGHSVLGLNWKEVPHLSPTQSLEKRGFKRPVPSSPVSSSLPWATPHEIASTSQNKPAGVDGLWAKSSAMPIESHHEAQYHQDQMEGGSNSVNNSRGKNRTQRTFERTCHDMVEASEMGCGGLHGKGGSNDGGMSWLEQKQRDGGSDAGNELSTGKGEFSTRRHAGKQKARRIYGC